MEQERPVCRFCLEPTVTRDNPFLSPCPCAGSVAFVHRKCLYRWIYQDPEEEKRWCNICHFYYYPAALPQLEIIPGANNLGQFFLNSSFSLTFIIQYAWLMAVRDEFVSLMTNEVMLLKVSELQFLIHAIYAALFLTNFQVKGWLGYLRIAWKPYLMTGIGHVLLLTLIARGSLTIGIVAGSYLSFYWQVHVDSLKKRNAQIRAELIA